MPGPARRPAILARFLVIAALAVGYAGAALMSAGASWAHAALIASDPAENAELTQAPGRVSATFNEPMQARFAAMTIIGPDGGQWNTGEPSVDGAVISVAVRDGGPSGTYTVNYRATSNDGHVVSGSWSYQLTATGSSTLSPQVTTAPTTAAAEPRPADAPGNDIPVWLYVAAVTVAVGAAALWTLRRRS